MFTKYVRSVLALMVAISFVFPHNTSSQIEPPTENPKGEIFPQGPSGKEDLDPTYSGWWTEFVGQTGGSFFSVDVVGSLAFATYGQRLAALDVSNPAAPRLLGKTGVMTGEAYGVAVQGDYAYLASPGIWTGSVWNGGALRVVDIADPTHPDQKVYFSAGSDRAPFDIALYGYHAFLAAESSLWVVDISDPLNPVSIIHLPIAGIFPLNLVVAQHPLDEKVYAYLTGFSTGAGGQMIIVDVTDPASPAVVGTYNAIDDTLGLAVQDLYAYVGIEADDTYPDGYLKVISISDPTHPVEVGSMTGFEPYYTNIVVNGQYAYITNKAELEIVSLANLTQPVVVSSLSLPFRVDFEHDLDLDLNNGQTMLYIPDDREGLRIVNVTNPLSPVALGSYNQYGYVDGVVRQGNLAYTSGTGFRVLEYLTPQYSHQIGYYPTIGRLDSVVDNHAFLIEPEHYLGLPLKLQLFDVSNPYSPSPEGSFECPIQDVDVLGDFAYIAGGQEGLRIVGITDTMNIVETSYITFTSSVKSVAVAPSYTQPGKIFAYVAADDAGLRMVDVTDPYDPFEVGFFDPAWSFYADMVAYYQPTPDAWNVLIPGDYVLVADIGYPGSRIYVIDFTDPATPVRLTAESIPRQVQDMVILGDYGYLAAGYRTLEIFWLPNLDDYDRNPAGQYLLPTEGFGVSVEDDFVSIAAGDGGLWDVWYGPGTWANIDPSGGVVTSTFDSTSYIIPSGVFTETATFVHTPRFQGNMPHTPGHTDTGHYFEINADNDQQFVQPSQPFTMTIGYDDSQLGGFDENSLDLYYWDGLMWVNEPGGELDVDQNSFTIQLDHFSLWGLMVDSQDIFLPIIRH